MSETLAPRLCSTDALCGKRLAEAVALLAADHAHEHHLPDVAVVAALCWVVGSIIGVAAREAREGLELPLDFVVQHVRRAASAEFTQRSYPLH